MGITRIFGIALVEYGRISEPVLVSSALRNYQSDIVVLSTSAELPNFINNYPEQGL